MEDKDYLQELRTKVLDSLVAVSDSFADDENVGYDVLIALARSTGNSKLWGRAYEKAMSIEDPKQRGDAMLVLLDEIELSLANVAEGVTTATDTSSPAGANDSAHERDSQVDLNTSAARIDGAVGQTASTERQ